MSKIMPLVLFIPDYGSQIGTGHLQRCLTLAKIMHNAGCIIKFFITSKSIPSIPQEYELATSNNINQNLTVIDNYHLDSSYHKSILTGKIIIIDDLADRKLYCDFLCDSNYRPNIINPYLTLMEKKDCTYFLGIEYCFIRDEFIKAQSIKSTKSIFVFFSGGTCHGMTMKTLLALGNSTYHINCVIGGLNPLRSQIENYIQRRQNASLFIDIQDIATLIAKADFCIGSFGSNTWERLFLSKPSLGCVIAENQRLIADNIARDGYAINLGWYEDINIDNIKDGIHKMETHKENMQRHIATTVGPQVSSKTHTMVNNILSYLT